MKATRIVEYKYSYNGADLAAERESLGLSQAEFAEITGVIQQHISQYERPYTVTIREQTKIAFEKAGIRFI